MLYSTKSLRNLDKRLEEWAARIDPQGPDANPVSLGEATVISSVRSELEDIISEAEQTETNHSEELWSRWTTGSRFIESCRLISEHLAPLHEDKDDNSLWCRFNQIIVDADDHTHREEGTFQHLLKTIEENVALKARVKELEEEIDLYWEDQAGASI